MWKQSPCLSPPGRATGWPYTPWRWPGGPAVFPSPAIASARERQERQRTRPCAVHLCLSPLSCPPSRGPCRVTREDERIPLLLGMLAKALTGACRCVSPAIPRTLGGGRCHRRLQMGALGPSVRDSKAGRQEVTEQEVTEQRVERSAQEGLHRVRLGQGPRGPTSAGKGSCCPSRGETLGPASLSSLPVVGVGRAGLLAVRSVSNCRF